jgi:hypothetical protein
MDRDLPLEAVTEAVAFHIEVVCSLQIQPEPIRGAEEPGQAKSGIRAHRTRTVHNLVDTPGRNAEALREAVLAQIQRLEKLLEKDLARVKCSYQRADARAL